MSSPSAPKQKMVWDDAAHLRLLLTIIAQHDITPNYKAVAAAFGNGVNQNILAQRMCALRKRAYAITGDGAPGSSPRKGRGGRPPKAASGTVATGKKTKAVKKNEGEFHDDEEEELPFVKEEGEGNATTTPPATPSPAPRKVAPVTPTHGPTSSKGKVATTPKATPKAADKVASGRVRKPRASPRKPKPITTYNEDDLFGNADLDEDELAAEEVTMIETMKSEGGAELELDEAVEEVNRKPFVDEYSEDEEDEYVPDDE